MALAGTSGDSRSLYVRRRASETRPLGYPALRGRYPLPRHPRHPAQHSHHRLRDGYRHRSADGDRHGAGGRHRRHPPQFRCRRPGRPGAAGQEVRIRNGGQSADHRSRRDAVGRDDADEGSRFLRHSGGHRRGQGRAGKTGRHSHQPRRAVCHRSAPENLRADDAREPRDGARRRQPGRGQADAAQAPHRETAGGRRSIPLRRPDHRQGHGKGGRASAGLQGCARPPARRGRDHRRRGRFRAHRAADRCRRRSDRRGHRARPFLAGAGSRQPHQAALQCRAGDRRQYRDQGRRAGADRCRRRCDQGRHRSGLDLHHPHRRRCRRAAAHRDHGCGRSRARKPTSP